MLNLKLITAANTLYENYPTLHSLIGDLYSTAVDCISEGLYTEDECIDSLIGTVMAEIARLGI